jgi:hypothetical protein
MCYMCEHELCDNCTHENDGEHRCCKCGAAVIFPQSVVCCGEDSRAERVE